MYYVAGCPEQPKWFKELDEPRKENMIKEIKGAFTVGSDRSLLFNVTEIGRVAEENQRSLIEMNLLATWLVENSNDILLYNIVQEPSWLNELSADTQESASSFLIEHIGKPGSGTYGLLSQTVALSFKEKYNLDIDKTLHFARYLFTKSGSSTLACITGTTGSMISHTQDLSGLFVSDTYNPKLAEALFLEVERSHSAVANIAAAFVGAYGDNTALWNLKHANIVGAETLFAKYYMRFMYNPHDGFQKALSILGGIGETEVREKIVELFETKTVNIFRSEQKALRKDLWRTATQQFARILAQAKQVTDERVASRKQVTLFLETRIWEMFEHIFSFHFAH